MARPTIPDALAMRQLKYGDAPDTERDRIARVLIAAGRLSEALLLVERRPDHPIAAELRDEAVRAGRPFALLSLRRSGRAVTDDELAEASRVAEAAGRFLDARLGYAALGDEEAIRRIADRLPPRLRPTPPESEGGAS